MKRVKLADVIAGRETLVGKLCSTVCTALYNDSHKLRKITKAGVEMNRGQPFFVWRWEPVAEGIKPDCGYSGIAVDSIGTTEVWVQE